MIPKKYNKLTIFSLGVFPQKQDSIVDGNSIKVLLKGPIQTEKGVVKGENPKLVNLFLDAGKIKCTAMTSLLASLLNYKTEVIVVEAMGIKTDIKYQPPVTYKYYVEFKYSYGKDGLLFWGWFFTMIILLALTWVFRMFRLIRVKKLMSHPKNFLIKMKKQVMDDGSQSGRKVFKKNFFGFAIKKDENKAMNGEAAGDGQSGQKEKLN